MSLYNIVFGEQPGAVELLALVNAAQPIDVGRYRDCWVEADGDGVLIRIHTRNGGGNRDDYEFEIESMRSHPWFVRDADDEFDRTYAGFWFRPPLPELDRGIVDALLALAQPPVDVGARWQAAIDAIRGGS